jgi:hypothetical protein
LIVKNKLSRRSFQQTDSITSPGKKIRLVELYRIAAFSSANAGNAGNGGKKMA